MPKMAGMRVRCCIVSSQSSASCDRGNNSPSAFNQDVAASSKLTSTRRQLLATMIDMAVLIAGQYDRLSRFTFLVIDMVSYQENKQHVEGYLHCSPAWFIRYPNNRQSPWSQPDFKLGQSVPGSTQHSVYHSMISH